MRIVSVILLCIFWALSGCSGNTQKSDTKAGNPSEVMPASNMGERGTQQLLSLLRNYYALKDALVAARAGEADNAANKLAVNADSLVSILQSDSNSNVAMQSHLDTIKMKVKAMTSMMDEGCEKKRIHFEGISTAMYALLKEAELKNAHIYQQYCPMAFNNKGAYWLSNSDEIRNPYFGDKMLECGEVTEKLN